jgi:hypothetical protein
MYIFDRQQTSLGQVPPRNPDPGMPTRPPATFPGDPGIRGPRVNPLDAARFLASQEEIRRQLERNFREDDEPGILDRRRRLRQAFQSVPNSFAQDLFGRLMDGNDPLARLFRYKIATATRNEMLSILRKKLEVI